MTPGFKIVQITRRFGAVGGMERFVMELSRSLAARGHQVTVLCEETCGTTPDNVHIIRLGTVMRKPRWLAALRFARKAAATLAAPDFSGWIIHSHERTFRHHIASFHGPPFAPVRARSWWKRQSLRIRMNLWLEQTQISAGPWVVPNSHLIAAQLKQWYPEQADRFWQPIAPAVGTVTHRPDRNVPADGGVIGFIGREWRRKGLERACEVLTHLKTRRPGLIFRVAGMPKNELSGLTAIFGSSMEPVGEVESSAFYADLDLLIHPAQKEPYGMVVAEAMAAGVPVVVSDLCGVAPDVSPLHGTVLSLGASTDAWSTACDLWLSRPSTPGFSRSWDDVADEYEQLYQRIGVTEP